MPEPAPDMLTAALAAWDAGLCVVKAKADGTKRPDGEWKQYQAERPSREQVAEWFKDGWPAMGCLTGAVSGDLEMLELEGRFVAEFKTQAFAEAAKAAGLELLLKRLITGMLTVSPSDGRHLLYRVAPGPVDGNTKLARRPATDAELAVSPTDFTKVLI
jgi:putative DNA primase/helicase